MSKGIHTILIASIGINSSEEQFKTESLQSSVFHDKKGHRFYFNIYCIDCIDVDCK